MDRVVGEADRVVVAVAGVISRRRHGVVTKEAGVTRDMAVVRYDWS